MSILALDLGGTKLATILFSEEGTILSEGKASLDKRWGAEVGALIEEEIRQFQEIASSWDDISSIGISVPGISYQQKGTVWAPNIRGWENYPLLQQIKKLAPSIPVAIDSDRACSILGESWKGAAQQCNDAIFLSVGTGIGAGILVNGKVLRGSQDIAGAIGWMALDRPFQKEFASTGCFESRASGEGIIRVTREVLSEGYAGSPLQKIAMNRISASDIFEAYEQGDAAAAVVVQQCIQLWGMAVANLVSLFNPEKIIMGGGVFGPAAKLIPAIRQEAAQWAQPVSMKQVVMEASPLGNRAPLYGAGLLAIQNNEANYRHV